MADRIWIMGASDGIGAAVARAYAARGAQLVLSARGADRLAELARELGAVAVPCDTADRASLEQAAAQIGPLDRAMTFAAMYDPGKVTDADPDRAAQIVTVNLTGSFLFARAALPLLRAGGQLALTGSVAGYVGLPQGQIYSATKAGVINLAETLRVERPDRDIRLICPGFVDTAMTQRNDFDMPAIMTPDAAAKAILRGLDGRRFEVHFPARLTLALKLLRALPYGVALRLTKRLVT
ncbi:SDR family oxidoreductase [Paracoccus sp. (in: a-proteobacteria)]|uniref:SDR family NAD(P)-dependent oxidoreductase n=1 Tax=Paracoccus sp. TaxID=267 RepID=UPI0026DF968D|nr:SDR family NAD(P)-dependent oxidoreductase [Paracoccus sp. (in: a-proteobacteria)]MDO5648899.1 SDR family NAD(P)-dependent oxidoreductase [Paracoccus sp. (in: a-proteobacteria)]